MARARHTLKEARMPRASWICALVLLASTPVLQARGAVEPPPTPTPATIEITKVFYFGDAGDAPDLKQEFMAAFGRRFGVRLVVHTAPRNSYMEKVQLMVTSGELTGLVLAFSPSDVLAMKSNGTILPLDYYLRDNAVWKSLPEHVRESHRFDEQIWGLPSGWTEGDPFARSYRKDWADRLGIAKPETLPQLYDMTRAFTYDDPDSNGRQDTFGMVSAGTWNLQDIFQASDARLNDTGEDTIVWDPNENAWVDTMLKPQMVTALRFLNRVYREGILDPETFTNTGQIMREKIWSGRYGSTFHWLAWGMESFLPTLQKTVPDAEVDYILALRGARTTNINHMVAGGGDWVLLRNTPDPQEMLNAFVNVFLGDEAACLWAQYGIEGTTFRVDGDRVIRLRDPATGSLFLLPGITSRLPSWPLTRYVAYPDGPGGDLTAAIQRTSARSALIDTARGSGLLYDASGWKDVCLSPTYTAIIGEVRRLFAQLVVRVATGAMTPEAAVAAYRAEMRGRGGQVMLEEANRRVGLRLPAGYTY
jgi:ABC-type glycerol-3-phosphate transport system substrate-binding protein